MILLIMTSYISVVKIIIFLIDKTLIKIKYYDEKFSLFNFDSKEDADKAP